MKCRECGKEPPEGLIPGAGICGPCVFKLGSKTRKITRDDLERAKREVELETAGLFPPEMLLAIVRSFADAVEAKEVSREDLERRMCNELQRLGGLGMCREMNKQAGAFREMASKVNEGIDTLVVGLEEEVKRKIRILSDLGRREK